MSAVTMAQLLYVIALALKQFLKKVVKESGNMMDLLYYMFYCSAGDYGTKSKHGMAAYGMELVATLFLVFLSQIIMGSFNIRFNNFIWYILILLPCPIISYYVINGYYIKSGRYNKILEKFSNTANKRKVLYKIIVILFFIISFVLLFVGGMIMSYLFSIFD